MAEETTTMSDDAGGTKEEEQPVDDELNWEEIMQLHPVHFRQSPTCRGKFW